MSDDTTAGSATTTTGDAQPEPVPDGAGAPRQCRFPGCDRPPRPDPATGRPSLYCEQPGADGGPIHNRVSAWRARRAAEQQATTGSGGAMADQSVAAPVSMARAALEQRVEQLPARIDSLRDFLTGVVADLRAAGDVEAAGAEVADAHRDALAKITAAEQHAADADRARRTAEQHAAEAHALRGEADAAAEDATAETTRVRQELAAQLEQVRAESEQAAAAARQELAATVAETEQARAEAANAREQLAALQTHAAADKDTITALRHDLEQARADARTERDTLQRAADDRAAALTQALAAARETADAYRTQLHHKPTAN